jgi:chitodextrinase
VYRTALVIGAFLCLLISSVVFVVPFAANAAVFTRPLVVGSQGADVSALQQILKLRGYFTSDVTGYFGPLTAKSLAKFQTANGIEALGGAGPKTRTLLNSLSGSVSGDSSSNPPSTSSGQANQALIDALLAQVKILQAQIAALLAGNTNPAITAGTPSTIQNYIPTGGGGGGGGNTVNSTPSSNGNGGGNSNNTPNYGNGPFSAYFTSGTFSIPAGNSPSSASEITVSQDTTVTDPSTNGSDSVKLKAGNAITKNGGGTLDVTALTTTDIDPASLTLPAGMVAEGAVQFGISGVALSLSLPTTISISVSPNNNGDTLTVYRAESLTGPWLTTGLSSPTCVVQNGLCQVDTTLASHFTATRFIPTVTISALPTSVTSGGSTVVTWSSTSATSCTASGSWSGSKATSGSQTFTNLTTSQTYTLTCSGKSKSGSATQSATVTVTGAPADTTAPSAPTSLAGSATSQTQINLTWTASTDNVGVTGYRVFRNGTQVGTPTVTSYSDSGLTASTAYTYTVKAIDAAGNLSAASNSTSITTLAPVPTVTITASPTSVTSGSGSTITWSSTNATTCTASGAWSGTKATSGTQAFTNLTVNQTYTLQCTGTGGSATQSASVTVTAPVDTTPPTVTITGPVSSLPSGTTQTTLTATTNEAATCRYSTNAAFTFSTGTIFTTTGATTHSTTLTGLTNGTSYTYYVKCQDAAGNTSGNASVTFAVVTPADTTPPSVTITAPAANLATNTTQTTLSVTTNENATCAQSTNINATFAQMTAFTTTGNLSHSTTLSPLTNGSSYTYYVKCQDTAGNISGNASVTFAVANPADTTAPTVPTGLTATAVSSSQINLSWTASTDAVGVTGYQVFRNGTQVGSPTTNLYSDTGLAASTLYTYTAKAFDAAGNVSAASTAANATTQAGSGGGGGTVAYGPDAYGTTWKPLKIGAGGFLDGMSIANDGTMVLRTDTYGTYLWNSNATIPVGNAGGTGAWQQLVTSASMPAAFVAHSQSVTTGGVFEIQIAPSNSGIMYMVYSVYPNQWPPLQGIYKSTDKGTHWTQTSFTPITGQDPNGPNRGWGQKMAINPTNPNIVYFGTAGSGLFKTTDGGNTWSLDSGVPSAADPGITGIRFNPSNSSIIFAASHSNGVYQTTNGGTSWSKLSGGPSDVMRTAISSNGIYFAIDPSQNLWAYASGAWTEVLQSVPAQGQNIVGVAVDPFNPNHVVVTLYNGTLNESFNSGGTWGGWSNGPYGTPNYVANDIPWLSFGTDANGLNFDPVAPGKLYINGDRGFWTTTLSGNITPSTKPTWIDQSVGIEQLVANSVLVPAVANSTPIATSWDTPVVLTNGSVYASTWQPPISHNGVVAGWSIDYASTDPNFVVLLADGGYAGGPQSSSYSTDAGNTWTALPTIPPGGSWDGQIAASTPLNFIFAGAGRQPYYTLNGGNTWNLITLPGVADTSGFVPAYHNAQFIAADRVLPNTFYVLYRGVGIFKTTNGGATWTLVNSSIVSSWAPSYSTNSSVLRATPGATGDIWLTSGNSSADGTLGHSTDGGATWTTIPNTVDPTAIGFGKSSTSYPSVYFVGWLNGVYGIWQSDDKGATWRQVGQFPLGSLDGVRTISGDPNMYGRIYVGFGGSGFMYGDTSGVVIPPADTTAPTVPNSLTATAISSTGINLSWTASTDNVGVTGYKIYRGGTQIGTSATNSYSDTGLTASTNYSYTVAAFDAASNTSAQSSSASATTQAGAADTTPPTVTITAPSGQLAANTTSTTLSVTTNETATCAYSATSGTAFASMTPLATTGGTSHSTTISGLTNGASYTTYVKCKDTAGNISTDSSTSYSMATSGGGGSSFSLTYKSSADIHTGGSTIDYGTLTYGPGCTRVAVAIGYSVGGVSVSSVTIGGTSGTAVSGAAGTATNGSSDIWQVPGSGSSGDVQVTYNGTLSGFPPDSSVALYCLVTTNPTGTGANFTQAYNTSVNGSIGVPTGGAAIAIVTNGSDASSFTWTNAAQDASGLVASAAHVTSIGTVSVTATPSIGTSALTLSLAAWGP